MLPLTQHLHLEGAPNCTATQGGGGIPGSTLDAVIRKHIRRESDQLQCATSCRHAAPPSRAWRWLPDYLYAYNEYMSTSNPRSWLILCICCMSLLIVGTDVTIVNVALPSIREGLHASLSELQWSVDAYTLVIGSLLMASGSTADRFGRRRVFQIGLALFTLGSLLCSVATSVQALILFRCLQALGGSMLNPVALSIVSNTFPEPRARARAMGVWGAVFGISLALGPVLGGLLVTAVSWRAIFWINVPIGIAAIVLARLFVPESKAAPARPFAPWAQLLIIPGLGALTDGVIEGPADGWGSPLIASMFAVAAVAAV